MNKTYYISLEPDSTTIDLKQYHIDYVCSVKSNSYNTAWNYNQLEKVLYIMKKYEKITIEYSSKYMMREDKLKRILQ